MRLATDEFINWLYEGCQRRHCYRVIFTIPHNKNVNNLSYCAQSIAADHIREAITFAQRIIEFENLDADLSGMVLEKVFKLPDGYGSRY